MIHLTCPVCLAPLSPDIQQKGLQCPSGHRFDQARQGYVNLLLSQHKKSKQPGDDAEMVTARREFLDTGLYQPIADALVELIAAHAKNLISNNSLCYSDIACGEGYYTEKIATGISRTLSRESNSPADDVKVVTTGIDISTPAIKSATRRSKTIQWLVASANRLPIETQSQNIASCMFCRIDHSEVERILPPQGLFIVASAASGHLLELRQQLYGDDLKRKPDSAPADLGLLRHMARKQVRFRIQLKERENRRQLLRMTPHFWRSRPDAHKRFLDNGSPELSVDIQLDLYQKNTSP